MKKLICMLFCLAIFGEAWAVPLTVPVGPTQAGHTYQRSWDLITGNFNILEQRWTDLGAAYDTAAEFDALFLGKQDASAALDIYSGITPSAFAQSFLTSTLNTGDTYSNFGVVTDDTINEIFAAIDDAIGGLSGGHTQNTDTGLGALGTKTTPVDADKVVYRNSEDSDNLVTSTWTQIKAFLKTYFDTTYQALDAETAKKDEANTWTQTQTFNGGIDITKTSGVPGLMSVKEADGTSTLYVGWEGPADLTDAESYSRKASNDQPNFQFPVYGTPSGTGDPNGNKQAAESWMYVQEPIMWTVYDSDTDVATGDGVQFALIPSIMNGWELKEVIISVEAAGTTGTTDVQIRRVRGATAVDMLSTKVTIDSGERDSTTAATAYVINTANDDIQTADRIFLDIDAISTTAPQGLSGTLVFRKVN